MTSSLISQIDMPGLVLVAALSKSPAGVYDADVSIGDIIERPEEIATYQEIPFPWPVVQEWAHRLREMRLLGSQSSDGRGGFGGLYLTELGFMLAGWTASASPASER